MPGPVAAIACFTFDNLGEAAELGAGELAAPRAPGSDPSLAIGLPRILALLERHGVAATFFVEGWNGDYHPAAVRAIAERGHEVGMHGWLHERWSELAPERERELAERATAALERAAGVRPCGFRAPGGERSAATEAVLRDLGYRYDASRGEGGPARLSSGLAQVPFRWPRVDGFHYLARRPPAPPAELRERWLGELEATAREGGLFLLIAHPFLSGVDEARLAVLDALLAAARSEPRLALHTAGQVAEAVLSEDFPGRRG